MSRRRLTSSFYSLLAGLAVLLLGLVAAGTAAWWQRQHNANEANERMEVAVQQVTGHIQDRMRLYEYGLRGVRGFVAGHSAPITREAFKRYSNTRSLDEEFPGSRGYGLIWRVPESDEARFVANARRDQWPDFAVRPLVPHTGERFVIQYLEPAQGNESAVGLDIASDPYRRNAAMEAAQSGHATMTGPITLVQAAGNPRQAVLVLLPIYRTSLGPSTAALRLEATVGWAYTPLLIDEVLQSVHLASSGLTLVLRDAQNPEDPPLFHHTATLATMPEGLSRRVNLQIFGRTWVADLAATPDFVRALAQPNPAHLAAGVGLLSVLLAALARVWTQLRDRVQSQRIEQARRASIVSASDDAIVSLDFDGQVIDWNEGAERLFGYASSEIVGHNVTELLVPPELRQEEAKLAESAASGLRQAPFETQRCHRSGELVDVSITVAPIQGERGEVIGYTKSLRDIRQSKRDRERLAALNASLEAVVEERTALLESTTHNLRAVLDAVPSMIGYWDRDLVNRMANQAYSKWFGVDPESMPGSALPDLLGPELYAKNRPHIDAALRGEPQTFERAIPRPDGTGVRYSLAHYLPDWMDGEVKGFYVLVHDVSELVENRQRLAHTLLENDALLQRAETARQAAESSQRFVQQVADKLPLSIAYLDGQMFFRFVNAAYCDQVTRTREDIVGRPLAEVDRHSNHPIETHLAAGQPGTDVTFESQCGNRILETRLVHERDDRGHPIGLFQISSDITSRKQSEDIQRRTLTLLHSVLAASTQVAIVAVNPEGLITLFNRGAEDLLGYRSSEVVGHMRANALLDREEVRRRAIEMSQQLARPVKGTMALAEPEVLNKAQDWSYLHKSGRKIPVSLAMTAIHDDSGALVGYLSVAHDVSEQQRHEAYLKEAAQRADAANLAKSQFLANMSHDIRTPMNAVIGLTHVLEKTAVDANQADLLTKMKQASQSLLGLLNDVLDLSKIEAAEIHLESAAFDLPRLLRDIAILFQAQADAKGVELQCLVAPDLPEAVRGDVTRLRQVLTNLVSNAVKFTEQGRVTLQAGVQANDGHRARLRFEVSDTGIGIPSNVLPRLFTPFVQADASTTRRFGGTGLGLSIVKELVTLMGGTVQVSSVERAGSRFMIELSLPLADASEELALKGRNTSANADSLSGIHVLVADDSAINLEVARRILEDEGARVTLAQNGQQALQALASEEAAFDLVLMDVQMPILDGCDATRRIRSSLGLTDLPVIALTAGITTSEHSRALAAGMNDVVAKPFDPEHLIRVMCKHLNKPDQAQDAVEATGAEWPAMDGVNAAAAKRRFKGDFGLYRSMLRRLLGDLAALREEPRTVPSPALVQRLHALKGNAGTLGAERIHTLAARAETACQASDETQLAEWLLQLHDASAQLQTHATVWLQTPEAEDHTAAKPADPEALAILIRQLKVADLAAIDTFKSLAMELRDRLSPSLFDQIRQQIDNLQFDDAAQALEAC